MKNPARCTAALLLLVSSSFAAQAAFTSLYVFGDGVSTTTNNNSSNPDLYYGKRFCNGRVWVEVLAQWQGLNYDSNKNWSFFGHYSPNLVTNVSNFVAPPDVATALFVVWVNNADFVYYVENFSPYTTNNIAIWTNAINQSVTNHHKVVTNLYAKGVRNLIMPNAVDIAKVPRYVGLPSASKNFIRQRIITFNTAFAATLSNAVGSLAGLRIHAPNTFALLDNVVANPAIYGLTNPGTGALVDPSLHDYSLNGPGANYVFWDDLHPTAKFQMVLAEITQQPLSPVRISNIISLTDSNRLDMENIPVGRNGFVDGSTNLVNWTPETNINSTNTTQTTLVPALDPRRFYRLRFPFLWSWP